LKNFFILFLILSGIAISVNSGFCASSKIKEPNVSGYFYPANKEKLATMLDGFLSKAQTDNYPHVYGLLSPHAGYIYSGSVAAEAYKTVYGKPYKTVIILSPTHHFRLEQGAVYGSGAFRTPLGDIPVDDQFVKLLLSKSSRIKNNPKVFEKEHALEVQLPFLQKTIKPGFSIVPIIIPGHSYELCEDLALTLVEIIAQRTDVLIVASSDLSHYHPQNEAKRIDKYSLDLIKDNDAKNFFQACQKNQAQLCGAAPVTTLMLVMKKIGVRNVKILRYATSADMTNSDENRVVGYVSAIFVKDNKQRSEIMIQKAQKIELLNIARTSMTEHITNKKHLAIKSDDPLLLEHRGAFVTINKKGQLRGCIGRIVADKPLIEVVNEMAIQASTADPRFPAITKEELRDVDLEISVMSPIKKITSVEEIEVGKHGLIIRRGFNSGLLLPQVATDYNWTREEFLEHTCLKAGLRPNDWQKDVEMFIFSAEVFSEKNIEH